MSYFNSQPHEEADIGYLTYWIFPPLFQLTASRRGWQSECSRRECAKDISTHSLTKRLTSFRRYIAWFVLFQLTASRRGWLPGRNHLYLHFEISTHSLTKRLTENRPEWSGWWEISTHSLTKRLTIDRGKSHSFLVISTHSLTKRLTRPRCNWTFVHILFQLTASRRGWQCTYDYCKRSGYFNSQPHEEADFVCGIVGEDGLTFQLTASRRGWRRRWCYRRFL